MFSNIQTLLYAVGRLTYKCYKIANSKMVKLSKGWGVEVAVRAESHKLSKMSVDFIRLSKKCQQACWPFFLLLPLDSAVFRWPWHFDHEHQFGFVATAMIL